MDLARPGDTISVRGGTYALTDNITITTSGTASQLITLSNHQGERVVVDGEKLPAGHTPVGGSIPRAERGAVHMEASHWRIYGLEIVNGPYGVYCDGCDSNVFARLSTHDNYESGFQLQGASSGNQILNLDSYGNRDPRNNGESADGNPGSLALSRDSAYGNAGTGFDADVSAGTARLTGGNLSFADQRPAAVGSGTVADGNSWNIGGTWDAASVLSTDPGPLTGPRAADGSLPKAPAFLVPRSGTAVGARL